MTIENNIINEIIINKSRFITYLYKVNNIDEIKSILNNLKNKYKDANHICYAYILDNDIKFNDNNEPSGTAGLPILEVLKKNNLNHVICLVIRFFGGIKLGAGGLVRAYSNSCSLALKLTNIVPLEKLFKIKLNIDYKDLKKLDNIINKTTILNKNYQDEITYELLVNQLTLNELDKLNIKYFIIETTY